MTGPGGLFALDGRTVVVTGQSIHVDGGFSVH